MRARTLRATAIGVALVALLTGCGTAAAPSRPVASSSSPPPLAGIRPTPVRVPAALAQKPFDTARTLSVPAGWTVSVWARTDDARLEAWTPDGRLLVSRPDHGDVQVLTPAADPAARPTVRTLVSGLDEPHGLAFDGGTLYVAETGRVDAYRYAGGAATGRRTVVDGLPDAATTGIADYDHDLKSVVVAPDHSLYVSVGSTANVAPADRTATPERATIDHVVDGRATVFARGVRNGTGLAVAPDGSIWTAVNNRDQIADPATGKVDPAYVADHPLEPVARLTQGRDLGWPYCDPDPGSAETGLSFASRPFDRDRQTNADGSHLDCSRLPRIEQGLPAHSAPLGMTFSTRLAAPLGAGALIAAHGSWDRTPPQAPYVAFLPWSGGTLQAARTVVAGFQEADGSRWGRPVDAVPGPDGALYVTDDQADAVYRLVPGRGDGR